MRGRPEVRISLRLDAALHEAVKQAAVEDMRSLNSQIELAIREHLERRRRDVPRVAEEGPPYRPGGAS
jgi:hypothetical protein